MERVARDKLKHYQVPFGEAAVAQHITIVAFDPFGKLAESSKDILRRMCGAIAEGDPKRKGTLTRQLFETLGVAILRGNAGVLTAFRNRCLGPAVLAGQTTDRGGGPGGTRPGTSQQQPAGRAT